WDISEQRRAEERLARNRQELRDKNQQLEEELKMASDIQVALLPQKFPTFPRAALPQNSAFQFTQRYLPTGTVGGDFFTVSPLSDTEAGVFICDVAGHGVRSALVTAIIRALVEELKPVARDPAEFLTKLNRELFKLVEHSGSPALAAVFSLVAVA